MKIFLFLFLTAISIELIAQNKKVESVDSTIYSVHTTKIQGKRYTAVLNKNGFYLLNYRNDTILKNQNDYFDLKFKDFNNDGYLDIYLDKGGNTPNWFDLFLYVPGIKGFKQIEDFNKFPSPLSMKGTKYFYSYHRSGCADAYWDSDLFYIENFKAVSIGNINGKGCDKKENEYGIYISKVVKEKKTLVKTFPIEMLDKYKDYKWGFIKAYWEKNYKKFL